MLPNRTARPTAARWIALVTLLVAMWPAVAPAQDATPVAASSAMQELLGLIPARIPGVDDPTRTLVSWADIAAQLDAVGVEAPGNVSAEGVDRWVEATWWLPLPRDDRAYLEDWREDYGFDLLQVDQVVSIDLPPAHLAIYRGHFDTVGVLAALEATGYRAVTVNGHELLSLRGDYEIDVSGPTAYRLAGMNFGVVLPDGTLAFASAGAPLATVLDVAAGAAPSMLDQGATATLLDQTPPDLVSALFVHGFALEMGIPPSLIDVMGEGTPDLDAVSTAAAGEIAAAREMPPVAMALLGFTAGGPLGSDATPLAAGAPEARAVAVVAMLDPASAETAARVVEGRLEQGASASTGRPWTELFSGWTAHAVPGASLLRVELALAEGTPPDILTRLLSNRDLGFLAW